VTADGVLEVGAGIFGGQIQSLSGSGSVLLGGQNLTLSNAHDIFAGTIDGAGGLALASGSETLSGNNSYTGATSVNTGSTLALAGSGSIALSSGVVDNGVLDIAATSNGAQIQSLSGSGSVLLGGQTLTLTNAGTTLNQVEGGYYLPIGPEGMLLPVPGPQFVTSSGADFSGTIAGSGGLTIAGGSEQLSGFNTYTGATSINQGATLALSGAGSIAASSGVTANGVLDVMASYGGAQIQSLSGSGGVLLGAQTLTLTNAADTFAGTVSGFGGLAVNGGGETLSGTNTYTGATTIGAAGTLALAGVGSIAASGGVVDNGVLDIAATNNGAQIQTLSGSGSVLLGGQTLTLTNAGTTLNQVEGGYYNPIGLPGFYLPIPGQQVVTGADFAGTISGSGGLTVAGGAEQLSGTNTYTGATSINQGATLGLAGSGSIALSSGVADNGVFDIAATSNGAQIQSLSGSGSVLLGGQTLALTNANDVFEGTISGFGGLAVNGGSETLANVQNYSGTTTIGTAGTLALAGSGSIASSNGVTADGVLDIAATSNGAQIQSLSGSGSVLLGGQTLTLNNAGMTFNQVEGGYYNPIGLPGFYLPIPVQQVVTGADFAGTISGSGGLTVASGAEQLSGTNTYTGATSINQGATLGLTGSGSIALSSGVTDNGVFDISATDNGAQIKSLSGVGSVALGGQTLTLTNANDVFVGTINGSGGLALSGGHETLFGYNSYTGATTIGQGATLTLAGVGSIASSSGVTADGVLEVGAGIFGGQIQSLSGSGSVLLGGQNLTLSNAHDIFAGTIDGAGGLALASGSETLSGNNSYTGATSVNTGSTLALAGSGSIALSSGVVDNGVLDIAATSNGAQIQSLSGSGSVLLGGQTLTLTNAGTTLNQVEGGYYLPIGPEGMLFPVPGPQFVTSTGADFSGTIAGSGGLTIAGGSEQLSGFNTYTGATGIHTGATLALSGAGSIAASSGVAADGIFDIAASNDGAQIRSLSGSGGVLLGGQNLTLTNAAGTFAGTVSGAGGLAVSGGAQTLSGANGYTGATTIGTAGTLALAGSGSIAASSGVADDGVFNIAATDNGATIATLSGSGSVILGCKTLTLSNASGIFAGTMDGGCGGLTVAGGVEVLAGSNTYTGATTIGPEAALALSGSGSIALSSGVVDNGTFIIAGTDNGAQIQSLSGSGSVILGGQTLTLSNANDVFAGSILGSGGLALSGGVETLAGYNGFTGATTIGQGSTLALAGAASLAASSGVANDGTLDISATAETSALKTLSGSGSVILGATSLTLTEAAGNFGGTISGSGGLAIASGTETLSGHNTYSGNSVIAQDARLALAGAGSIAASRVIDNGTLDIAAANGTASIKSLGGSGAVLLGANTLTLTAAGDSFGGQISGSGGLSLSGGSETLTMAQGYTGATSVANGATLVLAGNGAIAASSTVAVDGTLGIGATTGGASIKSLSGAGHVDLGSQTLTLTQANSLFGGVISGSGGLNVNGGSFTLAGNNSYTGKTSVKDATLSISSMLNLGAGQSALTLDNATLHTTASMSSDRAITLANLGTLDVDAGTTLAQTAVVTGSGTLVKKGTGLLTMKGTLANGGGLQVAQGTLALSGVNSYTGGTTVNTGAILLIDGDASLGAASGKLNLDGGTVQTSGSFDSARAITVSAQDGHLATAGADSVITLSGNIDGAGRLYKDGAGTLVLAGDNAGGNGALNQRGDGWTGGLTVNDGIVKVTNAYGLGWGSVMTLNKGTINATVDILTGQTINMGHQTSINTDTGTTTTLSGVLTSSDVGDGCFIKTGLGTLNVTGRASIDATCVMQGKLLANGSYTSKITVAQGATLGGSGYIQGDLLVRGTLSPGNSPGMLTANATVTMATGSTFKEDIGGSKQASASSPIGAAGYYSFLHVTGDKQFVIQPGVTLAPTLKDLYSPTESGYGSAPVVSTLGQTYRIITADGGIVGRFDAVTQPDGQDGTRMAAFYNYGGNNSVELKVLPASYKAWFKDGNGNSRSVAAALDQVFELDQAGKASALQDQLLYSTTSYNADKLGALVKDLAGEVHGALAAAAPQAGWTLQRSVLKRNAADEGRALWIDIGANHGDWRGDQVASGFNADAVQITVGGDLLHTPDARLGLGASHASTNLNAEAGSGSVHQNKVFVYGEAAAAGLVFDGIGSYGRDKYDSNRSDAFTPANLLRGHAAGNSAMLGAGVRVPLEVRGAKVEPFARVTMQKVERDAFAESPDSLAALSLDRYSDTGTRFVAGLSGDSRNTDPLQASTWRFSLGAGVDAGALARPTLGAALAQTGTMIAAPDVGRGFVQGGISGTLQMKKGAYLYLGVTGEARSAYTQVGGNGGVRVVF
jgi:fibronectin-binding autotransporter adhesin